MEYLGYVCVFIVLLVYTFVITRTGSQLKRENEILNAKLKELTDRDERGRFVGNKK